MLSGNQDGFNFKNQLLLTRFKFQGSINDLVAPKDSGCAMYFLALQKIFVPSC